MRSLGAVFCGMFLFNAVVANNEVRDDFATENISISVAIATAISVVGDAAAIANSNAINGNGRVALATSVARASTTIGNATAIANANAGN